MRTDAPMALDRIVRRLTTTRFGHSHAMMRSHDAPMRWRTMAYGYPLQVPSRSISVIGAAPIGRPTERDAMTDDTHESGEVRTMTASEVADAIGVTPKAFRSFWRAMVRKSGGAVGADTPGSGKRYVFNVTDADLERIASQYASHRRTNGGVVADLSIIGDADDV
jgi:hypothetical protein